LETRHFTRPELSCKMHCSPFSITICPRKEQKVSYYDCFDGLPKRFFEGTK
jgi:hypothetical protein